MAKTIVGFDKAVETLQRECSRKKYEKAGVRFRSDSNTGFTFLWDTEMAADHIGIPPLNEWDKLRWEGFIRRGVEFYNTVSDFVMDRIHCVVLTPYNNGTEIVI